MTMLNDFCLHILNALKPLVKPNDIDAWQGDGKLEILANDLGHGIELAKWRYNAEVSIERFPHKKNLAYELLAIVSAWLIEFWPDDEYELPIPEIDIEDISDDEVQITINIALVDVLQMVESPKGRITFKGKKYALMEVPIDWADEAEIQSKDAQ